MSDAELMRKVADGDPESGRRFAGQFQVLVYNVCYSFIHNRHDAEDVTQEVFLEAFRNAGRFRGDAKISTWLYRIAVNRSLNFIRKNRKRRFWQELSAVFDPGPSGSNSQEFEMSDNATDGRLKNLEQKSVIGKALDSLPENQRIAFTLNKMEDLSYAEVADVMQLSLSAVESLIHRARLGLQKRLKNYYF